MLVVLAVANAFSPEISVPPRPMRYAAGALILGDLPGKEDVIRGWMQQPGYAGRTARILLQSCHYGRALTGPPTDCHCSGVLSAKRGLHSVSHLLSESFLGLSGKVPSTALVCPMFQVGRTSQHAKAGMEILPSLACRRSLSMR